jgi:hypothetical protein
MFATACVLCCLIQYLYTSYSMVASFVREGQASGPCQYWTSVHAAIPMFTNTCSTGELQILWAIISCSAAGGVGGAAAGFFRKIGHFILSHY